jgi:hypothetical protein
MINCEHRDIVHFSVRSLAKRFVLLRYIERQEAGYAKNAGCGLSGPHEL